MATSPSSPRSRGSGVVKCTRCGMWEWLPVDHCSHCGLTEPGLGIDDQVIKLAVGGSLGLGALVAGVGLAVSGFTEWNLHSVSVAGIFPGVTAGIAAYIVLGIVGARYLSRRFAAQRTSPAGDFGQHHLAELEQRQGEAGDTAEALVTLRARLELRPYRSRLRPARHALQAAARGEAVDLERVIQRLGWDIEDFEERAEEAPEALAGAWQELIEGAEALKDALAEAAEGEPPDPESLPIPRDDLPELRAELRRLSPQ